MGRYKGFILIDGETGESDIRESSKRTQQSKRYRKSQKVVLLQPLRTFKTYSWEDSVNHYLFMKKTLFGKIMAPFAKWFNYLEMRFQIDTMRQQGLVYPS